MRTFCCVIMGGRAKEAVAQESEPSSPSLQPEKEASTMSIMRVPKKCLHALKHSIKRVAVLLHFRPRSRSCSATTTTMQQEDASEADKEKEPSFHSFLLLPGELQNRIWELASNAGRNPRGIHYFTVGFDARSPMAPTTMLPDFGSVADPPRTLAPGSAPYPFPTAELDPSARRSCFAIDYGMWTACRASRWAMTKSYTPSRRRKIRSPGTPTLAPIRKRCPGPRRDFWHMSGSNGEPQITLRPGSDLVVVQPKIEQPVDLTIFPSTLFVPRLMQSARNVGIAWGPGLKAGIDAFENFMKMSHHGEPPLPIDPRLRRPWTLKPGQRLPGKLFLIDHRLRLPPVGERSDMSHRCTFYGHGFRLVEVQPEDYDLDRSTIRLSMTRPLTDGGRVSGRGDRVGPVSLEEFSVFKAQYALEWWHLQLVGLDLAMNRPVDMYATWRFSKAHVLACEPWSFE